MGSGIKKIVKKQNKRVRTKIKKMVHTAESYNDIAEIHHIARRYFALNSFDGVLTSLGIMIASFFAGVDNPSMIIISCLGAAIAVAISGFYGAYFTEKSERAGKMKELEKNIGLSFKNTPISQAQGFAVFELAVIEGFSPFLISLVMLLPFFFLGNILTAYYSAFSIALTFLFILGAMLGKVSKSNWINAGLKMVVAGIVCIILLYFVEKIFNMG